MATEKEIQVWWELKLAIWVAFVAAVVIAALASLVFAVALAGCCCCCCCYFSCFWPYRLSGCSLSVSGFVFAQWALIVYVAVVVMEMVKGWLLIEKVEAVAVAVVGAVALLPLIAFPFLVSQIASR